VQKEHTIRNYDVLSKSAWTPYDGETVRGLPVATLLRGISIMRDCEVLFAPGLGKFMPPAERGLPLREVWGDLFGEPSPLLDEMINGVIDELHLKSCAARIQILLDLS
jgi:hypothetical protein